MRRKNWLLLAGCGLTAWVLLIRTKNPSGHKLPDHIRGFVQYATALEAQQVPLYRSLANACRRSSNPHLAVGLEKAMLVEQEHLDKLQSHAIRAGIPVGKWTTLGNVLGILSGKVLSRVPPTISLKVISLIENKAAQDYKQAYRQCSDETLRDLFLSNQVDEENHAAWAVRMLQFTPNDKLP